MITKRLEVYTVQVKVGTVEQNIVTKNMLVDVKLAHIDHSIPALRPWTVSNTSGKCLIGVCYWFPITITPRHQNETVNDTEIVKQFNTLSKHEGARISFAYPFHQPYGHSGDPTGICLIQVPDRTTETGLVLTWNIVWQSDYRYTSSYAIKRDFIRKVKSLEPCFNTDCIVERSNNNINTFIGSLNGSLIQETSMFFCSKLTHKGWNI